MSRHVSSDGFGLCLFCRNKSAVGIWRPGISNAVWSCEWCGSAWTSPFIAHVVNLGVPFMDFLMGQFENNVLDPYSLTWEAEVLAEPATLDRTIPVTSPYMPHREPLSAEPLGIDPQFHQFQFDDRLRRELAASVNAVNTVSGLVATESAIEPGTCKTYPPDAMVPINRLDGGGYTESSTLEIQQQSHYRNATQSPVTHVDNPAQYEDQHIIAHQAGQVFEARVSPCRRSLTQTHLPSSIVRQSSRNIIVDPISGLTRQTRTRRFQDRNDGREWKCNFLRKYGACDLCRARKASCFPSHLSREILLTVPKKTWDECPISEWLVDLN